MAPHQDSTALALFVTHRGALVNYASRIVGDPAQAEDVVQEARLRYGAAALGRRLEEPVGYLYRVVHNLALDRRRRLNLEDRHTAGQVGRLAASLADEAPSPEDEAIARQELQRVIAAMAELPERTRIALEMHRFGGCALKEIAERLGVSVSMAQVLVVQGIKHCQRALSPPLHPLGFSPKMPQPTVLGNRPRPRSAAARKPGSQPRRHGPLQFGRQAGLQASTAPSLVRNRRSAPVEGVMTWQQALSILLAGTGLTYRLTGSLVMLEAIKETADSPPSGPIVLDPIVLDPIVSAPEVTAAFGGTYFFDNGLSIGADASYTKGSFLDADNDSREKPDSRFLVNMQLTYVLDNMSVGFFARNLLDKDDATQRVVQNDGARTVITGEPRTFGLYVGLEF